MIFICYWKTYGAGQANGNKLFSLSVLDCYVRFLFVIEVPRYSVDQFHSHYNQADHVHYEWNDEEAKLDEPKYDECLAAAIIFWLGQKIEQPDVVNASNDDLHGDQNKWQYTLAEPLLVWGELHVRNRYQVDRVDEVEK